MTVGRRQLGLRSVSADRGAVVVGSVYSLLTAGQEVVLRLPGVERATCYAEAEDVAAWPTDLELTLERSIVPGWWRALAVPAVVSAAGQVEVEAVGPAMMIRARVSQGSTSGHGRVRIGLVGEWGPLLASNARDGSKFLRDDLTWQAGGGGSGLTHPQVLARGLGA